MTVAPVYVSSFLEAANHQPITSCCAAAIGHVAAAIRPNLPFEGATSHSPTVTHKKRMV